MNDFPKTVRSAGRCARWFAKIVENPDKNAYGSEVTKSWVSRPVSAMRAGAVLLTLAIVFPTVAELILPTENAILIVIAAIAAVLFFVFSFIFICVGTLLIIAGAAVFAVRWTKVRYGGRD